MTNEDLLYLARCCPDVGNRVIRVVTEPFTYGKVIGVCVTLEDGSYADDAQERSWSCEMPAGREADALRNCMARAKRWFCGVTTNGAIGGNEPDCAVCGRLSVGADA